jgi:hypothetical protein
MVNIYMVLGVLNEATGAAGRREAVSWVGVKVGRGSVLGAVRGDENEDGKGRAQCELTAFVGVIIRVQLPQLNMTGWRWHVRLPPSAGAMVSLEGSNEVSIAAGLAFPKFQGIAGRCSA